MPRSGRTGVNSRGATAGSSDANHERAAASAGFFCDFEYNEGQLTKERQLFFSQDCNLEGNSLDVSPFGVKNLASNVLEWTSATFVEGGQKFGVILGVDYSRVRDPGFAPDEDMAPQLRVSSDEERPIEVRATELVGFRCVTTSRVSPAESTTSVAH